MLSIDEALRSKKDIILNITGNPNIMLSVKFNAK